jgi:capsular polysaccharide biosynthesis protein
VSRKEIYEYPVPAVRLDAIPEAKIVGSKFTVVSRDRRVFVESYWNESNLNDHAHFRKQQLTVMVDGGETRIPVVLYRERPNVPRFNGDAVLVGNPWAGNYHHWMINCLGRLWIIDQFPELRELPLVVPQHLSGFQRASLASLGIGPERLLPFDGSVLQFRRLYFPSNGELSPTLLRWIRGKFYESLGLSETPGKRRLYISRGDANERRVVNESDLASALSKRGFEMVQFSGIPLADQVRTLAAAAVVIAPHGSGVTNLIFGSSHLKFLELHPRDDVNHVFWVQASAMQQGYGFVSGPIVNVQRDFVVDIDAVLQLLDRLAA